MKKHRSFAIFPALLCLALALALGSCASFKLVSQRPAAGASVDANSSATSPEASDEGSSESAVTNPAAAQPDAVTAATN